MLNKTILLTKYQEIVLCGLFCQCVLNKHGFWIVCVITFLWAYYICNHLNYQQLILFDIAFEIFLIQTAILLARTK